MGLLQLSDMLAMQLPQPSLPPHPSLLPPLTILPLRELPLPLLAQPSLPPQLFLMLLLQLSLLAQLFLMLLLQLSLLPQPSVPVSPTVLDTDTPDHSLVLVLL